ncbi:MAG: PilZ domain-containing protein, partial [Candidatus Omnitrophota bacterium]
MYEKTYWNNKRVHPRIAWSFIVRFKACKSESRYSWEVATIKDISLGGCYFYSNFPYEKGELLDLEVRFPAIIEPMKFIGEVKRCERSEDPKVNKYGIGIQFQGM